MSTTYRVTTYAAPRSIRTQIRTWTITAATPGDAILEARISHQRECGWDVSILIVRIDELTTGEAS